MIGMSDEQVLEQFRGAFPPKMEAQWLEGRHKCGQSKGSFTFV